MVGILLMCQNEREGQILSMAFGQTGAKVVTGSPGYHNYVKMLQFLPDIIIMEFPHQHIDQLRFLHLIKSHKKTKKIAVIGYGNQVDEGVLRGLIHNGLTAYQHRPLKFTQLLTILKTQLKRVNKSFDVVSKPTDAEHDLELLLSDKTLPTQKIQIMAGYVSKMMAFPFTVAKVLKITQDHRSGAADLSHAIEADPVIASHILRVANSVFFASLNRRINSIKDAIVRIGFMETKKIVMAMSVMKLFSKDNKNLGFDRVDFWYHSLAVAVVSSTVARHMGSINTEEAFLAGLLHDFGVIILDEYFPPLLEKSLAATTDKGCTFIEAEKEVLGIHHNDVVGELFPTWKLPENIVEGILGRWDILEKPSPENAGESLALCVAIGDNIAKTFSLGRECDYVVEPLTRTHFETVRMGAGITTQSMEKISSDIIAFRNFLELEQREPPERYEGIEEPGQKKVGICSMGNDLFVPPRHYLEKEGLDVHVIDPKEELSTLDNRFDLLLIWGREELSAESVSPFTRVIRHYAELPTDVKPEEVPCILMGDDLNAPSWVSSLPRCNYLPNQLDLRLLDKQIVEHFCPMGAPETSTTAQG